MVADWLIRVQTPVWLELVGIDDHAAALRGLPEITDTSVKGARALIGKTRREAAATLDAMRAASPASALNVAIAAAQRASRIAALFAAGSCATRDDACSTARYDAWDSAQTAAYVAALDAARDVARGTYSTYEAALDSAESALRPTVERLQESALELLDRLIKVGGAH